jgi:tetratricopeptide (TPR) repeat protein
VGRLVQGAGDVPGIAAVGRRSAATPPVSFAREEIMTDTEGARDDLRIALQYIDKYYDEKQPGYFKGLDFAMKYIVRARQKDPDATLKAKYDKDSVLDWTADYLEGHVLAIKGAYHSTILTREEISTAINLLEASTRLFPVSWAYIALANSYLGMARRADALAILKEAVQRWPGNMDIQLALDTIHDDHTLGKSKIPAEPLDPRAKKFIIIVVGFVVFFGSGYYAMSDTLIPTPSKQALYAFISLAGLFMSIVTFFMPTK